MIDFLKATGKWIVGAIFVLGAAWLGWQKVSAEKGRDKRRRQANEIKRTQADKQAVANEAEAIRAEADALDGKAKAIGKEIDARIEQRRNRNEHQAAATARRFNDRIARLRKSRPSGS